MEVYLASAVDCIDLKIARRIAPCQYIAIRPFRLACLRGRVASIGSAFHSVGPFILLHLPQIPPTEKPNAAAARGAKKIRTFPASFRFGVTLP
jgi:hypothetical protein